MNYKLAIGKRRIYCVTMLYRTPYETESQRACALVWFKEGEIKPEFVIEHLQQQAYKKLCACKGMKLGSVIIDKYTVQNVTDNLLIV